MDQINEAECLAMSPHNKIRELCVAKKRVSTRKSKRQNMNWSAELIRKTYGFDAVGVVREEDNALILLGLESGQHRNLDEFISGHEELENWCFSGIKKHFSPMIDKLLGDLEKTDPSARPVPAYSGKLPVKELAVMAGIGVQGRNTLVINDRSRGCLRFIIVITSIEISPTGTGLYEKHKNHKCDQCRFCEIACPAQVLDEYRLLNQNQCIAHIQLTNRKPDLERCNICWKACSKDIRWAEAMRRNKDELLRNLLP